MTRGEVYRVKKPGGNDPKKFRLFVVVSREAVIRSQFSTVICAPIYSNYTGLASEVQLSPADGVVKDCAIHCDELMSLPKTLLTHFVATLKPQKVIALDAALAIALAID
ncbi:MAG: type II toxin-antitoxin system PemK/MazF family toxin [Spirochaetes bacterium]|nr:type II toxin-antitoxin system PemK/MazF family toxin [Spirochaetota bacterium]